MYRSKDFVMMKVLNAKGKKVGIIKDLSIDYNQGEVRGFIVSTYNLFKRKVQVMVEDVITYKRNMIIAKTNENKYIALSNIIGMDVVDKYSCTMGMVEEVLFDEKSFKIKAIVVSAGFFTNLKRGKTILLPKETILGEENLLYIGSNYNIKFVSMPHKFEREMLYEKNT